ncbi:Glutamate-1-semialdehyde 2,1-aminomutase [Methylobacterium tardum]|uniref:Amino acid adenylation domain-containing protein n=1 Tax=Methylobacterium tardum TaxID=374432 RepID=A0AA37WTI4_9HYPH|nr:non-ribosomal peptide synthetase/type I polyketide synthase [Methylobacterium tardum]GJE49918.1 Glutamate-1-semialdehyde 2,1-aminomutase [Methylobacterium tardum]GLS70123.1 hypothetical protein GCM10007890_21360 [Methylobacterium tardum]
MDDSGMLLEGIAVIGMSGRFPGARTVDQLWSNLTTGVDSITRFGEADLEDSFPPETRAQPNFVRARAIIDDVDQFDAGFFGMYPREAQLTDPQHRVFLECAWEALEDGGYDPAACSGSIGVFAGCSVPTYFLNNVCTERSVIDDFTNQYQVGGYPTLVGAAQDFLATKTSYKLDLRGPSITSLSACSTSLLCVTQACQSLLLYQADMALAGGVSISLPQKRGYLHQDGGMVSADGTCRPFDAEATGTVFGSGAAVVLLKRLDDAVRDGDSIYAVIRGFGVNNDGATKVGYTAPSVDGQAACIMAAHAMAGVDANTIGYVECHGTATPLGDPIELAGLEKAFRASTGDRQFCALGSVKANIGHLDVAAGTAGLIKTCLALKHRRLPPMAHFRTPNPRFDFAASPFFVNTALGDWPARDGVRRAGVSAFGVGGTNVHLVLEEAPAQEVVEDAAGPQVLLVSARSAEALAAARGRLADRLTAPDAPTLADTAFTLQVGRRAFPYRTAIVADDRATAIRALREAPSPGAASPADPADIAFMFPGQGSQHPGMARGLYEGVASVRADIDRCAAFLERHEGIDLRRVLYDMPPDAAAEALRSTAMAQPALFSVSYALARLWQTLGLAPRATIGHSVGEFVSAHLAGVLTLEDALRVVAARGRLMNDLPGGAMLAVRLPEADLAPRLPDGVAVAAVNGPALSVASGPYEGIAALEAALAADGVMARRLHTSHAFHSPMMEPMVDRLHDLLRTVELRPPCAPYISCVTGTWITAELATSAEYWARHARETVRFHEGVLTLVGETPAILIEAGAGQALTTLAMQACVRRPDVTVVPSLMAAGGDGDDRAAFLGALGRAWVAGAKPDWRRLHGDGPRRVSLPTYPFERQSHWIEARPWSGAATAGTPLTGPASPPAAETKPMPVSTEREEERMQDGREAKVREAVAAIFTDLSGEDIAQAPKKSFLELGFDSLFLTQAASKIQARFGLKVAFRQLLGDLSTLDALTQHVLAALPPTAFRDAAPAVPQPSPAQVPAPAVPAAPAASAEAAASPVGTPGLEGLMREQLRVMSELVAQQLKVLNGAPHASAPVQALVPAVPAIADAPAKAGGAPRADKPAEAPNRFEIFKGGGQARGDLALTPAQQRHIADLVARYTRKTAGSKAFTERHRKVLADPRAVSGFRAEWKEMIYPIVTDRSGGSRLWDIDGNTYIDFLNGFGPTFLGHRSDLVVEAVRAQLDKGFEIGPQTALAGEVADLVCELTGNERATFCNTGSEAVMAAMRIARCVTGRDRIVMFSGSYHGQFDEVLVKRGGRSGAERALPAAPGIPSPNVGSMMVLEYADPAALDWIRAHGDEIAAVIVEPVQSRHPGLCPTDFLRSLRALTEAAEIALIFDEVVTGFRMHPGGMQTVLGIRADMATYGKVVGGGMPIGILAGKARFMDALDGGDWRFGDESAPEVGVTFFAGTFVRHPLALASARAVLRHLKAVGPALQEELGRRARGFVGRLNTLLEERGIASRIETFGSLFYFSFAAEDRLASLLYYHLRLRDIYIQEGFPCFLTTAHSDADLDAFVTAFRESLDALRAVGILASRAAADAPDFTTPAELPVPAAARAEIPASLEQAPLTEPQLEVWLAAQLGDATSCAFNESVSVRLRGPLDAAAFTEAFAEVMARHDALRCRFSPVGDALLVSEVAPSLVALDFSGQPLQAASEALRGLIEAEAALPFDLVAGLPCRASLVRLAPDEHVLVLTAHHIVCDGWSINVIVEELAALYAEAIGRAPAELGPVLPFSRYAAAQAEARATPELSEATRYWCEVLRDLPPAMELPGDRPRPAIRTFSGSMTCGQLDGALVSALRSVGAERGCTLFATLLAGFQTLLGRLLDERDVVVAVPFAGQSLVEDQVLVGHCVNLLPLRARWDAETAFATLVVEARRALLEAQDQQNCTLGTIVRALGLPRDVNRLPLTTVQFNLERVASDLAFEDLGVQVEANPKRFVNFDLFFNLVETRDGIRIEVDYSRDLFDEETVQRWIGHYRTLLEAAVANPVERVDTLPILSTRERAELLRVAAGPVRAVPGLSVPALVAAGSRDPDRPALVYDGTTRTHGEIDRRSSQVAHHLRRRLDGRPGGRIAVLVERSPDMLIALLAVMKAGYAYVPLDPSHPASRIGHILTDADVAGLLVAGGASELPHDLALPDGAVLIDLAADAPTIDQEDTAAPQVDLDPAQPAYVIYTSGSTGQPKGVEISHGAVVNFLISMLREPGLGADDALLAVTTVSFDIAVLELFAPLCAGGRVILATSRTLSDTFALLDLVRASGATVMQATPSRWQMLVEAGFQSRPGFRMFCGGEPLTRNLADALLAGGGELWNLYGPTETTVWSSVGRVEAGEAPITIGGPVDNTQLHVLDGAGALLPVGVRGQLHIGGAGLARGYLHRDELTAEKFIADPFSAAAGARLYRTGDLACRKADGSIRLLGRADHQVKLRGFRIEPEEIEAVLARHAGLGACAVVLREDVTGEPRLVCYFAEANRPVTTAALREALGRHLPDYMIPSLFVPLAALPLSPAGKVDRKRLPGLDAVPAVDAAPLSTGGRAPGTPTERTLTAIVTEVLGIEAIGIDDDMFAFGLDSLQVFRIVARAHQAGIRTTAKDLFLHRCVSAIAAESDVAPVQVRSRPTLVGVARAARRAGANGGHLRSEELL